MGESFTLRLVRVNSEIKEEDVDGTQTIEQYRNSVRDRFGSPGDDVKLIFRGGLLSGDTPLSEISLSPSTKLYAIIGKSEQEPVKEEPENTSAVTESVQDTATVPGAGLGGIGQPGNMQSMMQNSVEMLQQMLRDGGTLPDIESLLKGEKIPQELARALGQGGANMTPGNIQEMMVELLPMMQEMMGGNVDKVASQLRSLSAPVNMGSALAMDSEFNQIIQFLNNSGSFPTGETPIEDLGPEEIALARHIHNLRSSPQSLMFRRALAACLLLPPSVEGAPTPPIEEESENVTLEDLEQRYSAQLTVLQSMGFTNKTACLEALSHAKGDINGALELMLD